VNEPTAAPTEHDTRFTWGLIIDVMEVLERHGYVKGDNDAVGRATGTLLKLTREFEGRDR
jgi:hypothetical protein